MMMKTPAILMIWISLGFLTGCATGSKDTVLPQEGPTMKEVYDNHFNGEGENKMARGRETVITEGIEKSRLRDGGLNDQSHYSRTVNNEIQLIFPRLKNKTLVMYVFPHLAGKDRHPVPGYSTAIPFYKTVEYALPGEPMEGY
jgi:conjugative transfer region lipoprotein (TIGR03751 family)